MKHIEAFVKLRCEVLVPDDASDDHIYEAIVRDCYNMYGYEPEPEEIYNIVTIEED